MAEYPMVIAPAFWLSDRPILASGLTHFGLAMSTMLGVLLWTGRHPVLNHVNKMCTLPKH